MIKPLLTFIAFLLLSLSAQASIISHKGYSLDTDTHIVKKRRLEWLQWTETDIFDSSVTDVLAAFSGAGWRLATNAEMTRLFNDFSFGKTFTANENQTQSIQDVAITNTVNNSFKHFMTLFGITNQDAFSVSGDGAQAIYGSDEDSDNLVKLAAVSIEKKFFGGDNAGNAYLRGDNQLLNNNFHGSDYETGLALVRISAVNEPNLPILLIIAALFTTYSRRRLPAPNNRGCKNNFKQE